VTCKNITHLKRADKKLDEDAYRWRKEYRWFQIKASNVVTKWVTYTGNTYLRGNAMQNAMGKYSRQSGCV